MKQLLPFFLLLSFSACKTLVVTSQYDRGTSVDQYFSFSWLPGVFENPNIDRPTLELLQTQSLKEMIFKGFAYEKEKPEVLVNIEAITNENRNLENVRKMGFNYWEGYDSTQAFKPGDLFVELVDAESETVIWQGKAQNALTGNVRNEEDISRVLREIFGRMGQ
jgi:hypothetical protein